MISTNLSFSSLLRLGANTRPLSGFVSVVERNVRSVDELLLEFCCDFSDVFWLASVSDDLKRSLDFVFKRFLNLNHLLNLLNQR